MASKTVQVIVVGDSTSAQAALRQLSAQAVAAEGGLAALGSRMQVFGTKAIAAGKVLTKSITLPVIALGAMSIKSFSDFNAAMTESLAIMGDVGPRMREQLEDVARRVGRTTTISATQAAESYFFLASAGLSAALSMKSMPIVARFAQAGMFDMATATDLLTDAQSALGLKSDDTAEHIKNLKRVSDVFTKANILSNTSIQQISEAMTNKAGPALRALGKDVEEGAAVLAAFADQGLKGAAAGEALNIVMRDLQRAALKNKKEFKAAGVAVFDASGEMRNIGEIIGDLEGHLDGMSDAQRRAALTTLGFQDRSISNLVTLLGTSDAIREYERELRKAGGATKEVADKQLESFKAKMQLIKGRIVDVAITIGENLAPVVENLAEKLAALVEWFSRLSPETQQTILKVALFAAAVGPVLLVVGKLTRGIGKAIVKISRLPGRFRDARDGAKKFGRALGNLPGNIKNGVRAIVDLGKKTLTMARDAAEATVSFLVSMAKIVASAVASAIRSAAAWVASSAVAIASFAATAAGAVVSAARTAAAWVASGVLMIASFVATAAAAVTSAAVVAAAWVAANPIIAAAIALIALIIVNLALFIIRNWEKVKEFLAAVWNRIKEIATVVWNRIKEVFIGVWNTIRDFIVEVWNGIKRTAITVWGAITSWLADKWRDIKRIAATVWDGIKDAVGDAVRAVKEPVLTVWRAIRDALKEVWQTIKSTATAVWDGVAAAIKFAVNLAIGYINVLIRGMNRLSGALDWVSGPFINWGNIPEIPALAHGGIVTRPTLALVGESGPEAVIPLSRARSFGDTSVSVEVNFNGPVGDGAGDEVRRALEGFARDLARQIKAG